MAPRTTRDQEAKRVADKYIPPKGKPAQAAKAEKPSKKSKAPPEIRIVHVRAPDPKISDKESLFIQLYATDPECRFNGAEAARRAGYPAKSARQKAYELLTKVYIQRAIEIAKREQLARIAIDSDHLLLNLVDDMRADIADLFDERGALKPVDDWPLAFRTGLVAGIEVEELWGGEGDERIVIGQTKKIRLADRTAIKKLVGQHTTIQAFNPKRKPPEETNPLRQFIEKVGGQAIRPKLPAVKAVAQAIRPKAG